MKKKYSYTNKEVKDQFNLSFYLFSSKSKKDMVYTLEIVGALELLGLSKNNDNIQPSDFGAEDV